MVTKVRIGILGCANVAKKHAINAFKAIDNAELVCIASRDIKKAQIVAEEYGTDFAPSYDALLQRDDIDAVYIPLPIGLHEEWVEKAAKAKKHIICEKSLSDSYKSVNRILSICKLNDIVLYENFMCDFHPQHEKVLSLISDGQIGEPAVFIGCFGFPPLDKKNFRYDRSLGGGSLNDAGAYPTFMARKIFGEPTSVTCHLNMDTKLGVDIQGSAQLEFPGGKVGLVSFGFDNVYQNNYSIWGTDGLITVPFAYSIPSNIKPQVELLKNISFKEVKKLLNIQEANHFELIFQDFCNTIINKNREKIIKIYSLLDAQARVMEAMRISAREDRKVKIKEVKSCL